MAIQTILNVNEFTQKEISVGLKGLFRRTLCLIFGHQVNDTGMELCKCGAILGGHIATIRIRHVVSCFVLGHQYEFVTERDGHDEYACRICGHPLLFSLDRNPYRHRSNFRKKVRYFCNLFGHSVHKVTSRDGFTEYACFCGHTFLKSDEDLIIVKHPMICLFAGHFIQFVRWNERYREFLCGNCGHTFLL